MRRFKNYLGLTTILLIALSMAMPWIYGVPFIKEPGPLLDAAIRRDYQNTINKNQPSIVLLGDSVVDTGVDDQQLGLLTGQTVYKIARHGSASAAWYLLLENNIVTARNQPGYVIVFFRGSMLTTPEYRTTGTFQALIDELSNPDDQLLIDLAYVNQMNPLERSVDRYFPLYAQRQLVRDSLERKIKYPILENLLGYETDEVDGAINAVFGAPDIALLNAIINGVDSYLYQPKNLDFEARLPQSFLPEIIGLCRENGIQLIVVRTKVQQFSSPTAQPEGTDAYLRSLETYLAGHNVIFWDFGFDPRIAPEHFADALHLTPAGQEVFTLLLAEKLKSVLP